MTLPGKIGRYEVESLLGEGAMGSVFKARDPIIKRTVAIKTIKMQHFELESEKELFLRRFANEAQVCGKLNHPNIVMLFDLGTDGDEPFIAMEYLEGQTLDRVIRKRSRTDFSEVLLILEQVAEALDYAHEHGIVHRDIKPHNILITNTGVAKMMDFGIAKGGDAKMTRTGFFVGTPSYSSPEQISGESVDFRSDLFSFGVLAHELITGHIPFSGQNINSILYQVVNGQPQFEHIPRDLDGLSLEFKQVFLKMLHKDPAERFVNACAFVQALRPILSSAHQPGTAQMEAQQPGAHQPGAQQPGPAGQGSGGHGATTRKAKAAQMDTVPGEEPGPATARRSAAVTRPMPEYEAPTRRATKSRFTFFSRQTGPTAVHAQSPTAQTAQILAETAAGTELLATRGRPRILLFSLAATLLFVPLAWYFWPGGPADSGQPLQPQIIEDVPVITEPDQKSFALAISSEPLGARVFLDDVELGVTPLNHHFLDGVHSSHHIRVELEGFASARGELTQGEEWEPELHFALQPDPDLPAPDTSLPEGADPAELAAAQQQNAWAKAVQKGDLAAYRSFLEHYPVGDQAELARLELRNLEERAAFDQVSGSRNSADLRAFLQRYPNSRFTNQVRERIDQLELLGALELVLNQGSAGDLNAFLVQYGSICSESQREQVQARLRGLDAKAEEAGAFQNARQSSDIFALKNYLNRYGGLEPTHTEAVIAMVDRLRRAQQEWLEKNLRHKPQKKYKMSEKNTGYPVELQFSGTPPIAIAQVAMVWVFNQRQPQSLPLELQGSSFHAAVLNGFLDNGTLGYHFEVKDGAGERYVLAGKRFECEIVKPEAKEKVVITY
jgi:tRNA A-37 threonylcarbamoyl transferase component Bud32